VAGDMVEQRELGDEPDEERRKLGEEPLAWPETLSSGESSTTSPMRSDESSVKIVTEPTNYTKLSKKITRRGKRFNKLKPV
jgi:hypothetical protein